VKPSFAHLAVTVFSWLDEAEVEELRNTFPSPHTKEEDEWFQQAIEYDMLKNDLHEPNVE